jgi:hypothetical protein
MFRKPEGTKITVTAKFKSAANALTTPVNPRYRLTCETTGRVVTDWTALTPASSIAIPITTAIVSRANEVERKTLEVTSDDSADSYQFEVSRRGNS